MAKFKTKLSTKERKLIKHWNNTQDAHQAEKAAARRLEDTKERLKLSQRERQAKNDYWEPSSPSPVAKDQKYYEDVFQSGQKYYDDVFGGDEFKKYNQQRNSQQRIEREQRVRANRAKQDKQRLTFDNDRDKVIERAKSRMNGIDGMNYSDDELREMFNSSMKNEGFRKGDPMSRVNTVTDEAIRKTAQGNIDAAQQKKSLFRKPNVPTMEDEVARLQGQMKDNLKNQSTGGSPGKGDSNSSGEFNTKNLTRGEKFALDREMRKQDFFNKNTGNLTEEAVKVKLMKDFDLDEAGYRKFSNNTDGYRDKMFNQRKGEAIKNVSTMDNMMGNKVPQIAGGALLTAGLVSSMSSSKGQQSNAALYSQSQPYY